MKKLRPLLCMITALFLTTCGISLEKEETMKNSFSVELGDILHAQNDFVAFIPKIMLLDLQEGESPVSESDGYHGCFNCYFMDKDHQVYLYGIVGFDKEGFVAEKNNSPRIVLSTIIVDGETENISESKYNLSWVLNQKSHE